MTDVVVPALGESISSGILATWHVSDGDVVSEGQLLYELETDKITSEGMAEVGGKITLKAEEGDEVEIAAVIAQIDESVAPSDASPASDAPAAEESAPAAAAAAPAAASSAAPVEGESPAVRRIAAESGVDPKAVQGSGKDGRVTKGDMLSAVEKALVLLLLRRRLQLQSHHHQRSQQVNAPLARK